MSERSTDLGGAPTEWHEASDLAAHLRGLVKHGNDPTPHFRELIGDVPDSSNRQSCEAFLRLLERYLAAIGRGSVHSDELKHEIERFDLPAGA